MHKLASEILDVKDDDGELITKIWPKYEDVPECIKEASLNTPNDHQYAIMDGEFKKLALHDQGNVYLSLLYFCANEDKLPEELRKEAAVNIAANLTRYKDPIPKELQDMADHLKSQGVEVVTKERNWRTYDHLCKVMDDAGDSDAGKTLAGKESFSSKPMGESVFDRFNFSDEATTKEASAGTYLLSGKFPVNSFSQVKQAEQYFNDNWREFAPRERKEYCTKLAARMEQLDMKPSREIAIYGSSKYAENCSAHTSLRKQFVSPDEWPIIDSLIEKIGQVEPETYAEALEIFDKEFLLERYWDSQLLDPYRSTFGKEAEEKWRYNYRDVYIAEDNLNALKFLDLKPILGPELAQDFIMRPKSTFEKLPNDKKYVVARLSQKELVAS